MREIKFRAWDKETEKMWHNNTEYYHNDILNKPYSQNLVLTMNGEIRTCQWYENGVTLHDFSRYEIMQYTGLKDKSGREIYEGDILEHPKDGFGRKYGISWANDYAGFWYAPLPIHGMQQYGGHLIATDVIEAEVIGNIYENPELLEVKSGNH